MIKLQLSRHVLLLGLLACFGIACGDDSGDGKKNDAGGTGGGGSDAGGTGGGGTGDKDAGGKDAGGGFTKNECLKLSTLDVLPALCGECACTADPDATRQCGLDCWALLVCAGEQCGGKIADLACIGSKCAAFTSGAAAAMAMIASKVALECVDECAGSAATDGGTDDAGQ